jgi:hypothetical protein
VKSIGAVSQVKVSADGHGVLSHAGVGMLRELAQVTGLSTQARAALADTYRGHWTYEPGAVFADLVAAVADRATVSTGSERAALIASMFSALPPPRPRCGGWSMRGSTRPTLRVSAVPVPTPEPARVTAFITDTGHGVIGASSAAWSSATANTPGSRTAYAKPKPKGYATCPVTAPTRTRPGWK